MSFSRTRNSITALERKDKLTIDDLLEMMEGVAEDIYEYNQVEYSVSNLKAADPKKLLRSALRLINMLNTVCEDNQTGLSELTSILQKKLVAARAQSDSRRQELATISAETELADKELSALEAEYRQVEEKRGHLLTIKKQCDEVHEKIEQLSDPALNRMAEEKEALTIEWKRREEIAAEHQNAMKEIRRKLNRQEEELTQCRKDIDSASAQLRQCEVDQAAAAAEKARLESEIAAISTQIDELKSWLQAFPEWSGKLQAELSELRDRSIILLNAWNSAMGNRFLSETLALLPQESRARLLSDLSIPEQGFRNFDELDTWLKTVCTCTADLTGKCQEKLRALVTEAKEFTEPIPDGQN